MVALTWLVGAVVAFGLATGAFGNESLFNRLKAGDVPRVPGEASTGAELLSAASPEGPTVMLIAEGVDPRSTVVTAALERQRGGIQTLPNVVAVNDPGTSPTGAPSPFISADGRSLLVAVSLAPGLSGSVERASIDDVKLRLGQLGDTLQDAGATRILIGGVSDMVDEINHRVEVDLRLGEAIALPLSLLVMLVVFAGVLAAGMPILGAVASIAGGLLSLLAFSYVMDLEASVPSVVSILGLGLSIDYGLLLVSRYREEVRNAGATVDPGAAIRATVDTAGRTVAFSGLTVAISLAGLLFFHSPLLRAVGAAGTSVVLVAVLVALTLVPALLSLAGPRLMRPGVAHHIPGLRHVVRRLGDVPPTQGVFSRLATRVQAHPVPVFLVCSAVLLALAWPVHRMQVVSSGVTLLPTSSVQRQLFTTLDTDFPAAAPPAITVVSTASVAELDAWGSGLRQIAGITSVGPASRAGANADAISVLPIRTAADSGSSQAREVVAAIRDHRPDFTIWVTGDTAMVYDVLADVRARAPAGIGLVALATFVLLFLMTGSVLIPIKALIMNAMSLGASFGVLVWVFQDAHLQGLLNFTSNGGIDQNIPTLVLAFAFGLAMDYEVFLLARIAETRTRLLENQAPQILQAEAMLARHAHGPQPSLNDLSVRYGLQRSGRIITSAGLIMVIVFSGFVAGELLIIKQLGVALAVAVAIDATLVRMLLVPATMTLLGELNWWAPAPLRRLHDRFGLRESA